MNKYGEALHFHLADIPDIESDIPRSEFDENALNHLANKIIETGCLLKPLILKQIAPMQLKVLAGHFEYHAAVIANKLDTQRALSGMVSAFVVKSEAEAYAIEQANLLNTEQNTEIPTYPKDPEANSIDIHGLESLITDNVVSRLSREVQLLKIALQQEFQKQIHSQNQELLNAVNKLQETLYTTPPPITTQKPALVEATPEIEAEIVKAFNTWNEDELIISLIKAQGIGEPTAKTIIKKVMTERNTAPFKSLANLVSRNVLTKNRKANIIVAWSEN